MASVQKTNTTLQCPLNVSNRQQTMVTKTYKGRSKPKEGLGLYSSEGEIPIEYENACRLCLEENDMMFNIFSNIGNLSIADKIRSLLELAVNEDDELPSTVCSICLHHLDEFYKFKKRCIAHDIRLRQFLVKEPQRSSEPSNSSLIDQIDDFSSSLTKQECTLEWDDYSPLAIIYKSEPLSPKSCNDDSGYPYSQQSNNTNYRSTSSDSPIMTKLSSVPVNHLDNGNNETETGYDNYSEEEDADDPLSFTHDELTKMQHYRKSMFPSPTKSVKARPDNSVNHDNGTLLALNSRDCAGTRYAKECTATTSLYPRAARNQSRSKSSRSDVEDSSRTEIIQLDIEDVPLRDRLILEDQTRLMNRCFRCNDMLLIPPKEHILKCRNALRCSVCDKPFCSSSLLNRHFRIHTGEKPFECAHCDKAFTQKETLQRHFFSQHGAKSYICPLCDKPYATKALLSTHVRNVHERKRKGLVFKCKHCDKQFNHSSGLSRHQNFHNGTLFHCKICMRPFTDQSAISRHLKKAHLVD